MSPIVKMQRVGLRQTSPALSSRNPGEALYIAVHFTAPVFHNVHYAF